MCHNTARDLFNSTSSVHVKYFYSNSDEEILWD